MSGPSHREAAARSLRTLSLLATLLPSILLAMVAQTFANDNSDNIRQLLQERGDAWDGPVKSTNEVMGPMISPASPGRTAPAPRAHFDSHSVHAQSPSHHHWVVAHVWPKERMADTMAVPPVASPTISIYEDRTLRRGDAVMTNAGLRVFEGSSTFPYLTSDFSTLDNSRHIKQSLRKSLSAYNHQIPLQDTFAALSEMTIHLTHTDDFSKQKVLQETSDSLYTRR